MDLRVPPGAVDRNVEFSYATSSGAPKPLPALVAAFQLEARDQAGQPVTRFDRTVRLSIFHRADEFVGASSGGLAVFYYDEPAETWVRLPNAIDFRQRRLWVDIDHLTLFAIAEVEQVQDRLKGMLQPQVLGLSTSLWTGASSFAYPLDLPPAPGGNAPTLALSYSSEAVNQMLSATMNSSYRYGQAGPFGLGWSLQGGGAITRDNYDRYFLDFAGGSYRLVHSGSGDEWHTVPESFLQITHGSINAEFGQEFMYGSCATGYLGKVSLRAQDTPQWRVRTPDGTVYLFGSMTSSNGLPSDYGKTAVHWTGNPICSEGNACVVSGNGQDCGAAVLRPYRWNLESVQPPAGPGWDLTYAHSTRNIAAGSGINQLCQVIHQGATHEAARSYVIDTRLEAITYNNGRSNAQITYYTPGGPGGHRSDTPVGFSFTSLSDCDQQWIVSDHLVDQIKVQVRVNSSDSWNTLRIYSTSLCYGNACTGTSGNLDHAQLIKITEHDRLNSTAPNPPWVEFGYESYLTVGGGSWPMIEPMKSATSWLGSSVSVVQQHMGCSSVSTTLACGGAGADQGRIVVKERTVASFPGAASSRQTYAYENGTYVNLNPDNPNLPFWQFYGFGTVTERFYTPGVSAPIRKTVTLFNQVDEQCKGKIDRVTTYAGESGSELTRTINTWDLGYWTIGSDATQHAFPRLATVEEYAQGQRLLQKKLYYEPSRQNGRQFGSVTKIEEVLPLTSGAGWQANPARTTYLWYYPNFSVWNSSPPTNPVYIVNKPARTERYHLWAGAAGGRIDSQTLYYYDQTMSHETPPVRGLLYRHQEGSSFIVANYDYDLTTGNLLRVKDGLNQVTETFYDSGFQAFPVCVKNALGHAAKTRYYGVPGSTSSGCTTTAGSAAFDGNGQPISDRYFGLPEDVTDANNALSSFAYDVWGGLTHIWRPGDFRDQGHGATEIAIYTPYSSANAPFRVQKRQRDDLGGGNPASYLDSYTFYDGLGRVIQAQNESEYTGQRLVASTGYNAHGAVAKANLPYLTSGTLGNYLGPNWDVAGTETTYDELGRVIKVKEPSGAIRETRYGIEHNSGDPPFSTPRSVVYQIDANRRFVRQAFDPFGNLAVVSESTGSWPVGASAPTWGSEMRTRYTYDAANRLLTVTDNANNTTEIVYASDLSGQKVGMNDPDMGVWLYRWDAGGNLRKQRDAHNVMTCFHYDSLNRLVGKSFHPNTPDPAS
ncbi:MAG: hypothetical protein IAE85_18070, partial [Anaerolinea sp.]|nr:hypothetical protein [Anaerolinea sp.]